MDIALLLFEGITALDAIGPYEVLSRLPNGRVRFVAVNPGPMRTDNRMLALVADQSLADVAAPDIVVVPGGWGHSDLLQERTVLDWLRAVHATSHWTTSVCTGAHVLGAAGILHGLRATTHWTSLERLADWGAIPVADRVVVEGKVITAAGVSAGIDMALHLAAQAAGQEIAQAIQLSLEYDPQPPFESGSPAKASARTVELVRAGALRRRAASTGQAG
jgi:transcriptional regulator GlxA family with amidase domain